MMRLGFLTLLLVATLFGSGYWYRAFNTICDIPLHYRIGNVDEQFGTSKAELARIAQNAEMIWEEALGKELFIYDEEATFPIHLLFDERQENAEIEAELREDLDTKEGMSEGVAEQYEKLIGEFRTIKKKYETRVVSYESKLATYNDTVSTWNSKGGAPESVIGELRTTQNELTAEQKALEELAEKLNRLVTQLNAMGAKGNSLITDYNTIVNEYNERFGIEREFAQGDYTGAEINVYQFDSEDELTIVLAHEFGHSLSFDHVTNERSIMYHLMGKQTLTDGITVEDRGEFDRVCSQRNPIVKMVAFMSSFL